MSHSNSSVNHELHLVRDSLTNKITTRVKITITTGRSFQSLKMSVDGNLAPWTTNRIHFFIEVDVEHRIIPVCLCAPQS